MEILETLLSIAQLSGSDASGPRRTFLPVMILAIVLSPGLARAQGALINGENHTGAISSPGELDTWTFTAAQNDAIALSIGEILGAVDPGFWPWIRLRGPNGAQLGSHWGTLVAQLNVIAPLSGTYTVLVGSADSGNDATGSYRLTLAKTPGSFIVPAGDEGGPMTNGANHTGALHVGDLDQWTFTAAQNDAIALSIGEVLVGEVDPGFWPWIRLRGPNGAQLGSHWGSLVAQLNVIAPLSGTYTVLVGTADSGLDATGSYRLTLAKTPGSFIEPAGDEGGPMTNAVTHAGAIHVGDLDQWTFQAARNTAISVSIGEVVTEPDPGFWPWIRLRGPNGAQLGSHWGPLAAQINITAPLTGTYTVLVGTADSGLDATGRYRLSVSGALASAPERVVFGLGPKLNDGGWFATRKDLPANLGPASWGRLPWPGYNATGGGLRVAAGDLDGDGLDEIVAGLGPGGGGWIAIFDDGAHDYAFMKWIQVQWAGYNAANGEVWPAVGDLDGDGRAEIVAGLGAGSHGWFEIFDDAAGNFAHLAFRQVAWPAYNARATSVTRPAIGNVDGVGASEIILGLGSGSNGWIEVVNGAAGGYGHRSWFQVQWAGYAAANGTTFPAAGDLDGDGRAEVVVGLGSGGSGYLEVFEDANGAFAHRAWLRVSWALYNQAAGETHPAVGNIDGDARAEIVVGLGAFPGAGGWFETFDPQGTEFASLGWRNLGWSTFRTAGGATYPAIGRFR